MCDYQESVTTRQIDRQTEAGQSDPNVPLCFSSDKKTKNQIGSCSGHMLIWVSPWHYDPKIYRYLSFYAPDEMIGGILFMSCLSVCLFVCMFVFFCCLL